MRVYIGGPIRNKKFRDLELYTRIADIIRDIGFQPYIPHIDTAQVDMRTDEAQLYRKNVSALNASSFALFEITNPSHGVGMEIQHALANQIPFLCMARKGTKISKMVKGSIKMRQLVWYSDFNELREKLTSRVNTEIPICVSEQKKSNVKGQLISIEGIDFTGKSTLCKHLEKAFKHQKRNVVLVCDPPNIDPWQHLKNFFEQQQKISPLSEAILLLSARLDNYERTVKPALERGEFVISDRYMDSWLAYQSFRLESNFRSLDETLEFLINLHGEMCRHSLLSYPDLTILITDDPKETIKRAKSRKGVSKYEILEMQEAVQDLYLKIAERFKSRFRVIEAKSKSITDVFNEAYPVCEHLLR